MMTNTETPTRRTSLPEAGLPPAGASSTVADLTTLVTEAFDAGEVAGAPERIAAALAAAEPFELPFEYRRPGVQKYARHLIHRDDERDLVLIAMVWSPGQGTPVHDHGGYWCIEQVLAGSLESDIYHGEETRADGAHRLRFAGHEVQHEGDIAVLRPPVDHHAVKNSGSATAITLNIYGGELKLCQVFQPLEDGWYRPEQRRLSYDD